MSGRDGSFFRSNGLQVAILIDQLADKFEAAWIAGTPPRIADFIADSAGDDRVALIEELVGIDQVYRSQLGIARSRDEYRIEFPELPERAPGQSSPSRTRPRSSNGDDADNRQDQYESATAPRVETPLLPGYELLSELGRGSMGVVYKARQLELKRDVAVKMILAGSFAGAEQLARFRLETESVARLQHPHIVQIHEVGEHAGLPYCALEYVDGTSLANKINGFPQPPRQAAELVEKLARAVHTAHRHGIVHRDLKPANILLSVDGLPKITDFGLAKHLDADDGYTQTGIAVGTPSYMAPEQAEGRSSGVGPATDIYALGGILYEMLTGRPPFRGTTLLDTLEQVRTSELVPPRRLQPKLSRDLETICLKAMAREPSRRYVTAEELADDLRRWLDGKAINARPSGPLYKSVKWARRRPALAAFCALAIATAVGTVAGGWWHTVELQQALDQTDQARRQAEALRATSEQQRERAESMVYATDLQLASAAYLKGDLFETSRRLERHLPTPTQPDRREFTWKLLWALRQPNELVFQGHVQDAYVVRVVDDGRQLVTAGRDGTLRLWDISNPTNSHVLAKYDSELNFLAVAPGGVTLAVGGDDGTVRLWDLATRTQTGQFVAHANWVLCGAISPQGDRLATGGRDNTIRIWSMNGELLRELKGHTSTIESLAFLPDGRSLASTGTDKTVRVWEVTSGAGSIVGALQTPAYSVACSHDGRLLATGCEDHDIYLWDVESRSLRGRLTGHDGWVQCVEFSPDDSKLASAGKDGSVRVWDVARQSQIESLAGNSSRVWSVAWLPDGSGLASSAGDGTVRLWRRQLDRLDVPLAETPDVVARVFLSARGSCVYSFENVAGIWIRSANEPSVSLGPVLRPRSFAWCASRLGDRLAVAWSDELWPDSRVRHWELEFYDSAGVRLPGSLKVTSSSNGLVLALDATRLAVSSRNDRLQLYDVASGRQRWGVGVYASANSLRFSPSGDEVIAWSNTHNHVDAYRVTDGRCRAVLDFAAEEPWNCGLAVSPDGRQLATGGEDGVIRVWNYRSLNAEQRRLVCNDGQINVLAYSPDGRTLLAGTETGVITLWHTATWQQLARFKMQLGKIMDVCFSQDRDALAIAGRTPMNTGQILLWKVDSAAP